MQRDMVGFHKDAQDDWVAELSCGHGQHVRHKPPFALRPWVVTDEGRSSRLGQKLDCVRCDRFELPEGFVPYKRTVEFTNETIPAGLLRSHSLKLGTWGRLTMLHGNLRFNLAEGPLQEEKMISPGESLSIPPEMLHRIAPLGPVRFYIEFCSRPTAAAP